MRTVLAIGVLATSAMACTSQALTPPPAPGTGTIRTFALQQPIVGQDVLCTLEGAVHPVTGKFHGDSTAGGDQAWLVDPSGGKVFVLWPAGFTLRFDPTATLYDEHGRGVASEGSVVTFGQVNIGQHAGTIDEPYLARGIVFSGCYNAADGRR